MTNSTIEFNVKHLVASGAYEDMMTIEIIPADIDDMLGTVPKDDLIRYVMNNYYDEFMAQATEDAKDLQDSYLDARE